MTHTVEVAPRTIEQTLTGGPTIAPPVRSRSRARQVLLACGVLSSLLYITTDILGGLRYPGYSFTSQAISELAAIGAPTKPFVDPLFITYQLLALAFGVGVLRLSLIHISEPTRLLSLSYAAF